MTQTDAPPPDARLLQALNGFMISRCVTAVAELDVATALADGPLYYTELAQAVDAARRPLHRVMRLLASVGIFAEPEPGRFALTPVSELLRSDRPDSLRNTALMIASESHWLPWGHLTDTLRTGESGARHAFGTDVFTWFQDEGNKKAWETFNAAMSSLSAVTGQAVADAYDFGGFERIVDVGGGQGQFLRTVLSFAPDAHGVLFDLPGVVAGVDAERLGRTIEVVGGDFFESVPAGGDCYMLKRILHDWSDEHCRALLGNIAQAMKPEGTVVAVESILPETPEPHAALFMDVNMLVMTEGGTERSEKQFAELFESAGLKLVAIHPTETTVCALEAVRS